MRLETDTGRLRQSSCASAHIPDINGTHFLCLCLEASLKLPARNVLFQRGVLKHVNNWHISSWLSKQVCGGGEAEP